MNLTPKVFVNPSPQCALQNALLHVIRGGNVRRYHTELCVRSQTVGHHSFNVANIALMIEPDCSRFVLIAALAHDVPEWRTGDMPAPVKKQWPAVKVAMDKAEADFNANEMPRHLRIGLADHERFVLKCADTLDLLVWCVVEKGLGNSTTGTVWANGTSYLNDLLSKGEEFVKHYKPFVTNLMDILEELYESE